MTRRLAPQVCKQNSNTHVDKSVNVSSRYMLSTGLFLKRRYSSIYYCNKCKKALNISVKTYFDWKALISEAPSHILPFRLIPPIALVLAVSPSSRMIPILSRWLPLALRLLVIPREASPMLGPMLGLATLCPVPTL